MPPSRSLGRGLLSPPTRHAFVFCFAFNSLPPSLPPVPVLSQGRTFCGAPRLTSAARAGQWRAAGRGGPAHLDEVGAGIRTAAAAGAQGEGDRRPNHLPGTIDSLQSATCPASRRLGRATAGPGPPWKPPDAGRGALYARNLTDHFAGGMRHRAAKDNGTTLRCRVPPRDTGKEAPMAIFLCRTRLLAT